MMEPGFPPGEVFCIVACVRAGINRGFRICQFYFCSGSRELFIFQTFNSICPADSNSAPAYIKKSARRLLSVVHRRPFQKHIGSIRSLFAPPKAFSGTHSSIRSLFSPPKAFSGTHSSIRSLFSPPKAFSGAHGLDSFPFCFSKDLFGNAWALAGIPAGKRFSLPMESPLMAIPAGAWG